MTEAARRSAMKHYARRARRLGRPRSPDEGGALDRLARAYQAERVDAAVLPEREVVLDFVWVTEEEAA